MYSALACYLGKMTIIITKQMIPASFQKTGYIPVLLRQITPVIIAKIINWHRAIVDHETIQVTIEIIIKKRNLGSVGNDIKAILSCFFCETQVVIIDIKFVFAVTVDHVTRVAY